MCFHRMILKSTPSQKCTGLYSVYSQAVSSKLWIFESQLKSGQGGRGSFNYEQYIFQYVFNPLVLLVRMPDFLIVEGFNDNMNVEVQCQNHHRI